MTPDKHPLAHEHLPGFLAQADGTDTLFTIVIWLVVILTLVVGNFYLRLHALPEQMAHAQNNTQFQLITVLALIALFTHNNIFWIAALLLAAVQLPDYGGALRDISDAIRSDRKEKRDA
ncbi:hypothetical protein [Ruegeria atlantica]|uniref:hypothetical protein n=1 Tax=Ruegeria atlantica TaxID=81569 RepID=UPI00249483DF|nr:hypothetical protein [Ruegeria atlantica]